MTSGSHGQIWEYRSKVNASNCMWCRCAVGVSHQKTFSLLCAWRQRQNMCFCIIIDDARCTCASGGSCLHKWPPRKLLMSYNKINLHSHQFIV